MIILVEYAGLSQLERFINMWQSWHTIRRRRRLCWTGPKACVRSSRSSEKGAAQPAQGCAMPGRGGAPPSRCRCPKCAKPSRQLDPRAAWHDSAVEEPTRTCPFRLRSVLRSWLGERRRLHLRLFLTASRVG